MSCRPRLCISSNGVQPTQARSCSPQCLWRCDQARGEQSQGKRLLDLLRPGETLLVRWIGRLGHDYRDVSNAFRHFMREDGVVIKTVINLMNLRWPGRGGKGPIQQAVRDALIAFVAAMAEAPGRCFRRELSGLELTLRMANGGLPWWEAQLQQKAANYGRFSD